MTDLEKAIEAIEKQQGKLKKFSMAHTVGEQLKDILRDQPTAAGIVLQDLANTGMEITDCEKKIAAYAREHREGNGGCCPPQEADRIIREFYGIPARVVIGVDLTNGPDFTAEVKPAPKPKKFNLANYL